PQGASPLSLSPPSLVFRGQRQGRRRLPPSPGRAPNNPDALRLFRPDFLPPARVPILDPVRSTPRSAGVRERGTLRTSAPHTPRRTPEKTRSTHQHPLRH